MYIKSTNSTNTFLLEQLAKGTWPRNERLVRAGYQTAGRGQTGNGWESEPEKNLLCTVLLQPRKNLFELNMRVSIAVQRLLGDAFTIKWPNDIYWQDRKVAGILIENVITGGEVKYSVAGIGLNVNQTAWLSGAPNPISLKQINGDGADIDIEGLEERLIRMIDEVTATPQEEVQAYYKAHLYRKDGFWPFVEREVNTTPTMNALPSEQGQFLARIMDILPTGEMLLEDKQGQQRKYHFKQIRYVI